MEWIFPMMKGNKKMNLRRSEYGWYTKFMCTYNLFRMEKFLEYIHRSVTDLFLCAVYSKATKKSEFQNAQ